ASAIFLNDSPSLVKTKINKYAFSGGQVDIDTHRQLGGNTDVDVAYQYLRFLHTDDVELEKLGKVLIVHAITLKARCIEVVSEFVLNFQNARAKINDDVLKQFMRLPAQIREDQLIAEINSLKAQLEH
ncbi:hypothetical protein DI09_264p30, partial [Mitosporidium daphniae]